MGYYIRVLSTNSANIPLDKIREAVKPALLEMEEGSEQNWTSLLLKHADGKDIAVIEKNPVIEGQLGADELQEFIDEVADCKPESGAKWLQGYLPKVKVIYAFQVLNSVYENDGWARLGAAKALIWKQADGILQADSEGFSNEDGYTILWQFNDDVAGAWNVGVLGDDGKWKHFEMDLGNKEHRTAFQDGRVPSGVNLLS